MVDSSIQRLLDTVFNLPPRPGPPDIARLRAAALAAPLLLGGEPEPVTSVRDADVQAAHGTIGIRIYRPSSTQALPLMVYAHGGGWVTGSLDSHDRLCRILANRLAAVVVAVDYRCAPEHVYPAALDDVETAWHWARSEAKALGADGTRFAVGGDSSGGNLAAALALRLRAAGASQPALQLLLYPALDAVCSRESYRRYAAGFNLTGEQMAWYWDIYRAGAAQDIPELSPLAAPDFAGLAPAVIAFADADVLRDDALDYAKFLDAAGVPVRVIQCDGMIHGFLRWTGAVPAAHRWVDAIASAARGLLQAEQAPAGSRREATSRP
jgi:acetyl esterase/lipase